MHKPQMFTPFFGSTKLNFIEMMILTVTIDLLFFIYCCLKIRNTFLEFCIVVIPTYFCVCYVTFVCQISLLILCIAISLGIFKMFKLYRRRKKELKIEKNQSQFKNKIENNDNQTSKFNFYNDIKDGILCKHTDIDLQIIRQKISKNVLYSYVSDISRYKLVILFSICVFLSDFDLFNSAKCGKSIWTKGIKLMDFGVACFTVNAGFIYALMNKSRMIKATVICLLVGIVRLIFVLIDEYTEYNDAEYGRHLNFLFIIGFVTIFFILLKKFLFKIYFYTGILGIALCTFHECLLQVFLEDKIINTTRNNFISANIEGISFIIPVTGTMLLFYSLGCAYFKRNLSVYYIYTTLCTITYIIAILLEEPFRRTHNLSFVMTTSLVCLLNGGISMIISKINNLINDKLEKSIIIDGSRSLLKIIIGSSIAMLINKRFIVNYVESAWLTHIINISYIFIMLYLLQLIQFKSLFYKIQTVLSKKEKQTLSV